MLIRYFGLFSLECCGHVKVDVWVQVVDLAELLQITTKNN